MFSSIIILAVIGFAISLYAYFVERKVLIDPSYKAVCDLSDRISCTKPLTSKYANLFFISNSVAGMMFYALVALAGFFHMPLALIVLTSGGIIASAILGYLLYFKVKSICLVCTSLYIVNILLFIASLNLIRG